MGVYDPNSVDTMFLPEIGYSIGCLLTNRLAKPGFGPVGIFSQSGALASAILNEVSVS